MLVSEAAGPFGVADVMSGDDRDAVVAATASVRDPVAPMGQHRDCVVGEIAHLCLLQAHDVRFGAVDEPLHCREA
jgi:hypothetical protein